MTGRLTTHVLDTAAGRPAAGLTLRLYGVAGGGRRLLAERVTNADGRCDQPLLAAADMAIGTYEIEFEAGAYLAKAGHVLSSPPFLDLIPIRFAIADVGQHHHVPLLLAPFGYSTYKGS